MSNPTRTLSRLILSSHALYLVPAAVLHPSHRDRRWSAAWAALRYVVRTVILRRPSRIAFATRSTLIGRPGEFNPLHAIIRDPANNEMAVWQQRLRPGDLFIDAGANIGMYTVLACELGAEAIAVEPDPFNANRIRENLAINDFTAEVVEKALYKEVGSVVMTVGLNERNHLLPEGSNGRTVAATTLDELIGDRHAAVKIDVEGAELEALMGARRAMSEGRLTLLQLEWGLDEASMIADRAPLADLLASHGYGLFGFDRHGRLEPLAGTPTGLNVFAMPLADGPA